MTLEDIEKMSHEELIRIGLEVAKKYNYHPHTLDLIKRHEDGWMGAKMILELEVQKLPQPSSGVAMIILEQ